MIDLSESMYQKYHVQGPTLTNISPYRCNVADHAALLSRYSTEGETEMERTCRNVQTSEYLLSLPF